MKFSKSIYKALFIIAWAVTTTACSEEQYEINKVEEGLPASVTLSLSVPSALETTMTRATDEQETVVERAAFLFYKKSQPESAPIVVEVGTTQLGDHELVNNSGTHYRYNNITVTPEESDLTSGEWYLYVVANYGRNGITIEKLRECTKAEIDELCTTENQIMDITETSVLMSGKYDAKLNDGIDGDGSLTLIAGSNSLNTIKLKRLVAKSIFTIKPASGITFTLQSCELHKYPYSSTLMERKGWNGTDPGTLQHVGNANSIKDKMEITNFEGDKNGYSFSFYTQENAQPVNPTETFDYEMREERNDDYNTFTYAPNNATYVVIKGMYEGPSDKAEGSVTGNVTYTIHLGDFSDNMNNFSIRRNVKYNYTVTIAGVDKIIAEAKAESDFQNGAEGDIVKQNDNTTITVDAHYETVMLQLPTTLGDDYALSVKTPYTHKIYTSIGDILSSDDINWIKFGKPKSTTQFYSYTELYQNSHRGLCDIKVLLQELQDLQKKNVEVTSTHMIEKDNSYYVTAYINEYYYGNIDENQENISDFVNADDREMTLAKSMYISSDGHSTYTETPVFSIKQKSIKSCFDLEGCPNPFGIETKEETEPERLYECPEKTEGEDGYSTDWNYSVLSEDIERDGHGNTQAIGGGVNGIVGKKWDTFINQEYNGYIKGIMGGTEKGTSIMKSTYNYSIYQFLTRNRDLDGDGVIDDDEIRWYIPAHEQCMELWYGENSLPVEARLNAKGRNYLTSTPGISRTWWAEEGSSFGYWKYIEPDYWGKNAVRVVRSLRSYNKLTTEVAEYDKNTNVVTIKYLADNNLRTTPMIGNHVSHETGEEADKLPRKFKIAENYIGEWVWNYRTGSYTYELSTYTAYSIATNNFIGNAYYENDDRSEIGKWRVPNEKELGLMLQSIPELITRTGGRTRYKTRYYYVNDNNGKFITTNVAVGDGSSLYVRLVRDVE